MGSLEARYRDALEKRIDVIAYIGRYQGEPVPEPSSRMPLVSASHETKDAAVRELQTMAAFHGRDAIEELQFFKESEKELVSQPGEAPIPFGETSRYLWKATGVAVSFQLITRES